MTKPLLPCKSNSLAKDPSTHSCISCFPKLMRVVRAYSHEPLVSWAMSGEAARRGTPGEETLEMQRQEICEVGQVESHTWD